MTMDAVERLVRGDSLTEPPSYARYSDKGRQDVATILGGLVGGLLGAVVTGVAMRAAIDEPAPSATVWAMYFGDGDPTHYESEGLVVHAVYGALAGAVFVSFAGSLSLRIGTLGDAILWALVWSAVLAVIAVGFWSMVIVGDVPDDRSLAELGAVHAMFGIVLGLWLALVPGL